MHLVRVFSEVVEFSFSGAPDRVGVALDGVVLGPSFIFNSNCAIGYTKGKL